MKIKVELIMRLDADLEVEQIADNITKTLEKQDIMLGSSLYPYVGEVTVTRVETHN